MMTDYQIAFVIIFTAVTYKFEDKSFIWVSLYWAHITAC